MTRKPKKGTKRPPVKNHRALVKAWCAIDHLGKIEIESIFLKKEDVKNLMQEWVVAWPDNDWKIIRVEVRAV